MGKIVVSEFVTLDGVLEAPGGEPGHPHTGWVIDFEDDKQIQYKFEETLAAESLLIGRITYESFAGAWPNYKGEFADRMNAMPKHVVSTTLRDPAWNNTDVIDGDVIAEVNRLSAATAGDVLVTGSISLVHSLIEHDLVDEYRLMIFPVILGSGRKLFPESPNKTTLKPTGTTAFPSGVIEQRYVPASR